MSLDPEDVIADWGRRVELQTILTEELSESLLKASASAESPGGEAVVTVDHSGGLADLTLSSRALRMSSNELAETILATSRRAQAALARQVTEVVNDLFGADSGTAAFIGGTYTEQFPEADDGRGQGARR